MRAQGTSPAIPRLDRLDRSSHTLGGKDFRAGPELSDHELSCLGGIAGNHGGDAENPVATELDLIATHIRLSGRQRSTALQCADAVNTRFGAG
jgi:L-rhamnose isomerase